MRRYFTAQLGLMQLSTIVICLGKFPGFPCAQRMLSSRSLTAVVSVVGQAGEPLTEPARGLAAPAVLSSSEGDQQSTTCSLPPLHALHILIKCTNYKPLGWWFCLTKETKTGTGFGQPFGDNFPSSARPKLPLQMTSHFSVLFCATASKDIHQNCFHCYSLKNHIFSKKPPLSLCFQSDKVWHHVDFLGECFRKRCKSMETTRLWFSLQLSHTQIHSHTLHVLAHAHARTHTEVTEEIGEHLEIHYKP